MALHQEAAPLRAAAAERPEAAGRGTWLARPCLGAPLWASHVESEEGGVGRIQRYGAEGNIQIISGLISGPTEFKGGKRG